jgi:hypothetical protein
MLSKIGALLIGVLVLSAVPALAQNSPGIKTTPGKLPVALPFDPLGLNPSVAVSVSGTPEQITTQINTVIQKIKDATAADLNYALALAKNANTPGSNVRATCYAAIIVMNQQINGTDLKNADGTPLTLPDPSAVSHIEQVAELMDSLGPTAPLMVSCAAAANAIKQNALQFIGTVLSAVAVKGVTGGLPIP